MSAETGRGPGPRLRDRRVQLHWSNVFGTTAAACLVVLMITGVILMIFYDPSADPVVYQGPYGPLTGTEVSRAFRTTMRISFEVPGGLLLRQAHHWAALLLPAAVIMQLLVTFFTGAFRRPNRLRWLLLFGLLLAALLGGWSGYALPDDALSGTGLRIFEGILLGIPVLGTFASGVMFGDAFPGRVLELIYPIHVWGTTALLLPVVFGLVRSWIRRPAARFAERRRIGPAVAEVPLLPNAAVRAAGLFALALGVIMVMGGTMTISPIWLYGPADAGSAYAGSQPDWYTGFLDGALRLVPPGWEISLFGRTWTLAVIAPLAVISGFLLLLALYPWIEERLAKDRLTHDVLDQPHDAPTRSGIGVAGMIFYGVLWGAASADIVAHRTGFGLNQIIVAHQVALVIGPALGFLITRSLCRWLQRRDAELAEHGVPTGEIVRLPGGGYTEDHFPALPVLAPLAAAERPALTTPPAKETP